MISVAKKIGRATWPVVSSTSSASSARSGFSSRRRSIASVTTIAPSTMMPKSIAPSENRLAGMCSRFIAMNTATSASGIAVAATNALRGLPRNRISTMQTRPTPSSTVCVTFSTVSFTSWSRSM